MSFSGRRRKSSRHTNVVKRPKVLGHYDGILYGSRRELTQKELTLTQGAKALQQKLEMQRRERGEEVSAHQQALLKIRAELQDMVQQNETKIAMVDSRMEGQIVRFAEHHSESYEQLAAKIGLLEKKAEAERQSYRNIEVAASVFPYSSVCNRHIFARRKKELKLILLHK